MQQDWPTGQLSFCGDVFLRCRGAVVFCFGLVLIALEDIPDDSADATLCAWNVFFDVPRDEVPSFLHAVLGR